MWCYNLRWVYLKQKLSRNVFQASVIVITAAFCVSYPTRRQARSKAIFRNYYFCCHSVTHSYMIRRMPAEITEEAFDSVCEIPVHYFYTVVKATITTGIGLPGQRCYSQMSKSEIKNHFNASDTWSNFYFRRRTGWRAVKTHINETFSFNDRRSFSIYQERCLDSNNSWICRQKIWR